ELALEAGSIRRTGSDCEDEPLGASGGDPDEAPFWFRPDAGTAAAQLLFHRTGGNRRGGTDVLESARPRAGCSISLARARHRYGPGRGQPAMVVPGTDRLAVSDRRAGLHRGRGGLIAIIARADKRGSS